MRLRAKLPPEDARKARAACVSIPPGRRTGANNSRCFCVFPLGAGQLARGHGLRCQIIRAHFSAGLNMSNEYDADKDLHDSYYVAIDAMRKRLKSFRREEIGDATLYLGDCREILPLLPSVDAVVTDPPYGLGDWNNRGSNAGGPFDSEETSAWDVAISAEDVEAMRRKSKHQIFWGANYDMDGVHLNLPSTKQMLIWDKTFRGMHFNDCEIAWCSQWREASRVFGLHPGGLRKEHPTQKPLALMEWCINSLPATANIILDPYMGSGTTGVACVKLGRKFIGVEKLPKYFDIACRRIADEYKQPRLMLDENRAVHAQCGLFEENSVRAPR